MRTCRYKVASLLGLPNEGVELLLGEGGERLHEWVYGLASWREQHGLAGGQTDRDAEVIEDVRPPETTRIIKCPGESPGLDSIGKRVKQDASCI